MTWQEVLINSRKFTAPKCAACPVCNGRACSNNIPGPGAKGYGDTAMRNFDAWQEIRLNMDTICENEEPDTSFELFGKKFKYPIFAGPVGAVKAHYCDKYDDKAYSEILVRACAAAGIAAFTGDGLYPEVMKNACEVIRDNGGLGVPTVKPWDAVTLHEKFEMVRESGAFAAAMDIDAAGLPFMKGRTPPAGSKTVEELGEIIRDAGVPFIVKGVMTVKGAEKAIEAGAAAILVSNHGGRVLDGCAATAHVLPEIADAVNGRAKILVDGGIRTGTDIFRAIALGANGVVIARPFVTAVYGGEDEGVRILTEKLGGELYDAMQMCGAKKLSDISRDMIRY